MSNSSIHLSCEWESGGCSEKMNEVICRTEEPTTQWATMKAPVSFFTYLCLVSKLGSHRLPRGGRGVCRLQIGQLHTSCLQETRQQIRAVVDPDLFLYISINYEEGQVWQYWHSTLTLFTLMSHPHLNHVNMILALQNILFASLWCLFAKILSLN